MQLSLKLEDYLDFFLGSEQSPLSLELILEPFGFFYHGDCDTSLVTGLFLDCLSAEFERDEWVDPIDVASSALELGYEPAMLFLEEAPWLMVQAVKRGRAALMPV